MNPLIPEDNRTANKWNQTGLLDNMLVDDAVRLAEILDLFAIAIKTQLAQDISKTSHIAMLNRIIFPLIRRTYSALLEQGFEFHRYTPEYMFDKFSTKIRKYIASETTDDLIYANSTIDSTIDVEVELTNIYAENIARDIMQELATTH